MQNNNWRISDWSQRRARAKTKPSLPLKTQLKFTLLGCAWLLMLLVVLLAGCATQSPQPCATLTPPSPPALSELLPSESYSVQLQRAIESWRKRLTAMPATSTP